MLITWFLFLIMKGLYAHCKNHKIEEKVKKIRCFIILSTDTHYLHLAFTLNDLHIILYQQCNYPM